MLVQLTLEHARLVRVILLLLLLLLLKTLISVLIVIFDSIWNLSLILTHSLLKHIQSLCDDFELGNNFFKSLSKFLTWSRNSSLGNSWCIGLLKRALWCFDHLRRLDNLLLGAALNGFNCGGLWLAVHLALYDCSLRSSSWPDDSWSCWGRLVFTDGHNGCLASKVINQFLLVLVEVRFPDHDNWIVTTWSEVVTAWWELNWVCGAFMTIKCVENVTLSQIPDFDSAVGGTTDEVATIRVESNIVDTFLVSIVVLNKALWSNIPNFDRFISGAASDASAIRVESNAVDTTLMIIETTNVLFRSHIPQFYETILWTRGNKSSVRAELGRFNPVGVCRNTPKEFTVLKLEAF